MFMQKLNRKHSQSLLHPQQVLLGQLLRRLSPPLLQYLLSNRLLINVHARILTWCRVAHVNSLLDLRKELGYKFFIVG